MNSFMRIFFIIFIILPSADFAADKSITEDREIKTITLDTKEFEGKLKAGIVLGYPWGITAGYRFSNFFELNSMLGSDYNDFTASVNGLFTIFNLKISHELFPLTIGPALYSHFGYHDGSKHSSDGEYTRIDILGIARIEYSFKETPVNMFAEGGAGLEVVKFAGTAGSFAVGVRYIF